MALMTVSLNNAPLTVGGQKGHPLCKEGSEGSGGRRAVVPLLLLLLLHPPLGSDTSMPDTLDSMRFE